MQALLFFSVLVPEHTFFYDGVYDYACHCIYFWQLYICVFYLLKFCLMFLMSFVKHLDLMERRYINPFRLD